LHHNSQRSVYGLLWRQSRCKQLDWIEMDGWIGWNLETFLCVEDSVLLVHGVNGGKYHSGWVDGGSMHCRSRSRKLVTFAMVPSWMCDAINR
jgi:hypothetical protein